MLNPEFWGRLDAHCATSRDRHHYPWGSPNDGLAKYLDSFGLDLEDFGVELRQRLERVGANEKVALDLAGGSQGVAVADLIRGGFVSSGLTVDQQAWYPTTEGVPQSHLMEADLTTEAGWQAIFDWQVAHAPEGLALILHRPVGALQRLPADSYSGFLDLSMELLAPGGILLAEIPSKFITPFGSLLRSQRYIEDCLRTKSTIEEFKVNLKLTPGREDALEWVLIEKATLAQSLRI